MLVEDRAVGAHLGGDVAEVPREAGAHLGDVEAGPIGVLARREREELLVTIAVERVGCVVQTGLRDGAHLVEERDDVDAATLVAVIQLATTSRELLAPVFLQEVAAAFDRGVRLTRAARNLASGTRGRRRA